MGNKIINQINRHIQDNFWLYIVCLLCICVGIVLGIYTVKYMGELDREDLNGYLKNFLDVLPSYEVNHKAIFVEAIKNNIPLLIGIWFLGLTMVGVPVILILDVLKGFTLGFTISFIINSIGLRGVWGSILGVIPQNIIYISCTIFASVVSMQYSLEMIKSKAYKHMQFNRSKISDIAVYSLLFLFITVTMLLGFFIEVYATPGIVKYIFSGREIWII